MSYTKAEKRALVSKKKLEAPSKKKKTKAKKKPEAEEETQTEQYSTNTLCMFVGLEGGKYGKNNSER